MEKLKFAISCIRRTLDSIENDAFLNATIAPEIEECLEDIAARYSNNNAELNAFIAIQPWRVLRNELFVRYTPPGIQHLVAKLADFQARKEEYVSNGDFRNAARCRDDELKTKLELLNTLDGVELTVTEDHLLAALAGPGCLANTTPPG